MPMDALGECDGGLGSLTFPMKREIFAMSYPESYPVVRPHGRHAIARWVESGQPIRGCAPDRGSASGVTVAA